MADAIQDDQDDGTGEGFVAGDRFEAEGHGVPGSVADAPVQPSGIDGDGLGDRRLAAPHHGMPPAHSRELIGR